MQTFLPYPDFLDSAKVLDKQRCWKQVVEAKQIINTLEQIEYWEKLDVHSKKIPWANHPAVQMWKGHTDSLKAYFNVFLKVSIKVHKINTKYEYITDLNTFKASHYKPWWLGKKKFHRAMRARLIEKDRNFYLPKFPKDDGFNNSKYFWPVMNGSKTFKII